MQQLFLRSFGARGDGQADDTRAVQRALDAAADGPTLVLDPGTYRCSEPLLVGSDTHVLGIGAASVLAFPWFDQRDGWGFCVGNRARTADQGNTNIRLQEFVIEGGTGGLPYGEDAHTVTHGLSLRKSSHVEIAGVEVRQVSGFGICLTGAAGVIVHGCRIHDVGRDGITSFPLLNEDDPHAPLWTLEDLTVAYNDLKNVGDDAIAVHAGTAASVNRNYPPEGIVIEGNTIHARLTDDPQGQGRGICISGVHEARIERNTIHRTVSTGILIQDWGRKPAEALRSRKVRVLHNALFDPGRSVGLRRVKFGMQVKGADEVEIERNAIFDAADRGIDVRNASKIEIARNQISGAGGRFAILASGADEPTSDISVIENLMLHKTRPAYLLHEVAGTLDRDNLQVTTG